MVSYVIVTRNPTTRKLVFVSGDDGSPAEFGTEDEAFKVAESNACCRAWGAEIVPVDR
jgi:hypothetical protein